MARDEKLTHPRTYLMRADLKNDLKRGGRYWTRTSDPCDVNTVLYQLS
jgi:hypothetical protein